MKLRYIQTNSVDLSLYTATMLLLMQQGISSVIFILHLFHAFISCVTNVVVCVIVTKTAKPTDPTRQPLWFK